jgi:glycine/serine hydroxymethyltransferase
MKVFEVKVKVQAPDIMKASLMGEGIQNVLAEIGTDNQQFLIDLADKQVTKSYAGQIIKAINNPMIKKLFGV